MFSAWLLAFLQSFRGATKRVRLPLLAESSVGEPEYLYRSLASHRTMLSALRVVWPLFRLGKIYFVF